MYSYVGIRGHRGAGKNTVSYLLGVAIDYYLNHNRSFKGFETVYDEACERIKQDEEFINEADFNRVYFDSFADIPKGTLSMLTNIPFNWMKDDFLKDSVFFNMKDFSIVRCKDKLEAYAFRESHRVFIADALDDMVGHPGVSSFDTDIWISLRELIVYFGKYVIQHHFGRAAWVNALRVTDAETESFYANDKRVVYKIFTDVKFPTEVSYIKDKGGLIIKVDRPDCAKEFSEVSVALNDDTRIDYEVTITDDVTSIREQIEKIAQEIVCWD